MARYLTGRVLQAVGVLWAAYTVAYAILYLLPGDTLAIVLQANNTDISSLNPEQLEQARAQYGLDKGPIERYVGALGDALHGNFGVSLTQHEPVTTVIASRLPGTIALASLAIAIALVVGVTLAWLAAYVRWRPARWLLNRLPAVGVSVPLFWIGLLLIQVFAFHIYNHFFQHAVIVIITAIYQRVQIA